MHLLYLDDDRKQLAALRRALGRHGIRVGCFQNVDAFLAAAPSSDADAFLLDYHLETTDGLTVFQSLRAQGVTTPCVLYSGVATEDERIAAHEMRFATVVPKGTTPPELAALLRNLLSAPRTAPAPSSPLTGLTLDPESGILSSPNGIQAQLAHQSLALLVLLARAGAVPLRRGDLAPRLFEARYPTDIDARKNMDDRIAKVLSRLRDALGDFKDLLHCHGGRVALSAQVTLTKSGMFHAVRRDEEQASAPVDTAPPKKRTG